MRKVKYRFLLLVLIVSAFYNCGNNPPAPDKMLVNFESYPRINYSGIETLRVYVEYWIPDSVDYVNKNYELFFEGLLNQQVQFSSPPLPLNNLSYDPDSRYEYLYWIGDAPSGNYYLRAWFKKLSGFRATDSISDVADSITAIMNSSEFTLIKWCGDKRYGNIGDTLRQPAAYPIFVRVINEPTGQGLNDKYVQFSALPGILTKADDTTENRSVPLADEFLDGLAWTSLILSSGITDYTVTATCEGQSVTFDLLAKDDGDTVSNDTLKIHECWYDALSPQISGDGYWGANDPDISAKNLKLEADYDNMIVSYTILQKALDLLKDSLYSQVGVKVSYVIDNTFGSGYINRTTEKQLLAINRNATYKGIGIGYAHVMFASTFEDDSLVLCGRAVTYRDVDWENVGGTTCAYYGSGDLSATGYSQAYLDSVGCMIYVKPSCRTIPSSFIDSAHVLALIAAHEIGHSIGLGHRLAEEGDTLGIMTASLKMTKSYNYYAYFAKPDSSHYNQRWLINLRKILGRETIDFMW